MNNLLVELSDGRVSARRQRDNALVAHLAVRAIRRLHALVGIKAGFPAHPVSRAQRDAEMVMSHVTLNWRQAAVHYMRAVGQSADGASG